MGEEIKEIGRKGNQTLAILLFLTIVIEKKEKLKKLKI